MACAIEAAVRHFIALCQYSCSSQKDTIVEAVEQSQTVLDASVAKCSLQGEILPERRCV